MPNVSQRDSTAIAPGGEVSARHTNYLRSSASDHSSFLDRRIRHHQVLGKPAFAAVAPGDTHMFKLRRHWLEDKDDRTLVLLLASLFLGVLLLFFTFQFLVETFEQPSSALPLERPSSSRSWYF
jgi:hypothetical protein